MAYTNFCCRSGGSNLNAGTRKGDLTEPGTSPLFTYASGNWVSGTGTFTVASGNPLTDGIVAGDFVSIYANGATTTNLVGRVGSVTSTTIVMSGAVTGTLADGTGTRTLRVGGAWKGPNAADGFPFGFVTQNLHDGVNFTQRVNMKNDAVYSISVGLSHSTGGTLFRGYTTSYADGGMANINGGTNAIVLLTVGSGVGGQNLIVSNNGTTGANAGFALSVSAYLRQCVAHDIRGNGFNLNGSAAKVFECEAYLCNASNTAFGCGFSLTNAAAAALAVRCNSHHNAGSNSSGYLLNNSQTTGLYDCIASSNGQWGCIINTFGAAVLGCDFYNNAAGGISGGGCTITSCNFVKNGGWAISGLSNSGVICDVINCGFGSGTQANTSGQVTGSSMQVTGSVTYASDITPWVDPANGDFRINLAAAKGTGRGLFTQTQAGYAGTIGYPDIGAAQSKGGGGGFVGGMNGGFNG
jgi:hypothetical protein